MDTDVNIIIITLNMNTDKFIISNKQIELDQKIAPYELWATKVHVLMLHKQKIIGTEVAKKIINALSKLTEEEKTGKFRIAPALGLHLTIEDKVIKEIGDSGYSMHTSRSRNDAVWTSELLYLREKMLFLGETLLSVQTVLVTLGNHHVATVMPGYTHMQPAKPTTLGQWCLAYHDMLKKCMDTLKYYFEKYDLCPLGAVESYGTSWNIDREYTSRLLGFSGVWEIPQEAVSSRGFVQLAYLSVMKDIAITVSKIATDLLLFNTFEYGYVTLSDDVAKQMGSATGSSVMPQKKNPDVLELLRSLSPQIIGYENIVANILSCLPMGYNRDSREVKEYIESGFDKSVMALSSLENVLKSMKINKDRMLNSVKENYSLSTDLADSISQKTGLPYRKVYKLIGQLVKEKINKGLSLNKLKTAELKIKAEELGLTVNLKDTDLADALDPKVILAKRNHIGGASVKIMKQMIGKRKESIAAQKNWLKTQRQNIKSSEDYTSKEIRKLLRNK